MYISLKNSKFLTAFLNENCKDVAASKNEKMPGLLSYGKYNICRPLFDKHVMTHGPKKVTLEIKTSKKRSNARF